MNKFKVPKVKYAEPPTLFEEDYMGWKSPIEIAYGEMQTKIEGDVVKAIQSYNIQVDKDELIKALQYDRHQYERGRQDAINQIFKDIETSLSYKLINGEIHLIIREVDYNHYKKKYTESEGKE